MTKTIDLGGLRADHPDWSKNPAVSNTIVFTSMDPNAGTTDQRPATGAIDMVTADSTGAWGAPQELVPAVLGKNRYYPAISPDGNLVVYDESTCTHGTPTMGATPDKTCDGDTDATATMYLTSLAGAAPVPLTHANSPGVADGNGDRADQLVPEVGAVRSDPGRDEQDDLADVLVDPAVRAAHAARAGSMGETTKGTLIWMVGINPGVGGVGPQLLGVLPAVPGRHDVEPHRPVDEVLHPGSGLSAARRMKRQDAGTPGTAQPEPREGPRGFASDPERVERATTVLGEELVGPTSALAERSDTFAANRRLREQTNRESVAAAAIDEISRDSPDRGVGAIFVDEDWLTVFGRVSETRSDLAMQAYFARILAGEVKAPRVPFRRSRLMSRQG